MSHPPDQEHYNETAQELNPFEYAPRAPIVLVSVNSVFQQWEENADTRSEFLRRWTNTREEVFEVSGIGKLVQELEKEPIGTAVSFEVGEKDSMHNLHIDISPELSTNEAIRLLALLLIKGDLYGQFNKGKDHAIISSAASGVDHPEGLINFVIHSPVEGVPAWDINIILSLLSTHSIPFSLGEEDFSPEESRLSLGGDLYTDAKGLIHISDRVELIPEVPDYWYPNLARGLPYYIQIALRKTARWEFMKSADFQENVLTHTQRITNDLGRLFLDKLNNTSLLYWTQMGLSLELYLRTLTLALIHDVGEGFSEFGDIDATDPEFEEKKVRANEAERAIIIGLIQNGHLPLFPENEEIKRYWLNSVLVFGNGSQPIKKRIRYEKRFGRILGDKRKTAQIAEGLFSHERETTLEMEFVHLVDKVVGNVFAHQNLSWQSMLNREINGILWEQLKEASSIEEMRQKLKDANIEIINGAEIKAKRKRVGRAIRNLYFAVQDEYSDFPKIVLTKATEEIFRGVFWYITSSYQGVKTSANSPDGNSANLISRIFYLELIEEFEAEGHLELSRLLSRDLAGKL